MTRVPQHQHTASTVAKLLDVTVDLLHDCGLAWLSTSEIAANAGVSCGALTHHFDSKEAIITGAIKHQLSGCTAALHNQAVTIRHADAGSDELVDYAWHMMSDRLFYVTMEYLPEAVHNPEFRRRITPVVKEFHQGLKMVWNELAEKTGVEMDRALVLMNAPTCLMGGMIAQTTVRDDPDYFATLLDFWKKQVRREFRGHPAGDMTQAKPVAAP